MPLSLYIILYFFLLNHFILFFSFTQFCAISHLYNYFFFTFLHHFKLFSYTIFLLYHFMVLYLFLNLISIFFSHTSYCSLGTEYLGMGLFFHGLEAKTFFKLILQKTTFSLNDIYKCFFINDFLSDFGP